MPSYLITDNSTGKKFKVTGDSPPTEMEAAKIFSDMAGSEWVQGTGKKAGVSQADFVKDEGTIGTRAREVAKAASPYVRPVLEGAGMIAGAGIAGTAGGLASFGTGSIPAGVAGGALGYAGGKNLADMYDEAVGLKDGGTMADRAKTSLADLATGATLEMGGRVAAPVLSGVAKGVGKVVKPILGKMSGTGTETINQAIKSGESATGLNPVKSQTAFDKALRGEMSGEEVVDSARTALNALKQSRLSAYQGKLQQVQASGATVNMQPIRDELTDLMGKYNVKIDPATGAIDTSRTAMGKAGRNDIAEIVETVNKWGSTAGDDSAIGLDTLKRQLDDFYSDSSQARQFVQSLKKKVSDTVTSAVPEYGEMTKGYSEVTRLIKDVESGLMMRKNGMTGRVTADQTLNRLMSAMRNDGIKKELIDILGTKGGEDVMGAVAGYTSSTVMPRGIQANLLTTSAPLAVLGKFVDPTYLGIVAASSPRVQGEFLRLVGRAKGIDPKTINQAVRLIGTGALSAQQTNQQGAAQ
jgi:hypothetical protein